MTAEVIERMRVAHPRMQNQHPESRGVRHPAPCKHRAECAGLPESPCWHTAVILVIPSIDHIRRPSYVGPDARMARRDWELPDAWELINMIGKRRIRSRETQV